MSRRRPYTIAEASQSLGIKAQSILEAVRRGRLKGRLVTIQVPRKVWLLDPQSVETYVVSASHQERGSKNP